MAGKIIESSSAKALWPALQATFEAAYDTEKQKELEEFLRANRKPLTRWQKFKAPFREVTWRLKVAFDVLRYGDDSNHIRDY